MAFAVFRSHTISNFIACRTGKSAGFAPFQGNWHSCPNWYCMFAVCSLSDTLPAAGASGYPKPAPALTAIEI